MWNLTAGEGVCYVALVGWIGDHATALKRKPQVETAEGGGLKVVTLPLASLLLSLALLYFRFHSPVLRACVRLLLFPRGRPKRKCESIVSLNIFPLIRVVEIDSIRLCSSWVRTIPIYDKFAFS